MRNNIDPAFFPAKLPLCNYKPCNFCKFIYICARSVNSMIMIRSFSLYITRDKYVTEAQPSEAIANVSRQDLLHVEISRNLKTKLISRSLSGGDIVSRSTENKKNLY